MLLSNADFISAIDEARIIAASNARPARSYLTNAIRHKIKSERLDFRSYTKLLLIAYLASPYKFQIYRNGSSKRPSSTRTFSVVFDIEPFKGPTLRELVEKTIEIEVDEVALVRPISLRDYIKRVLACDVDISSIQFGCLQVEYVVHSPVNNWREVLQNQNDYLKTLNGLSAKTLY